jgi:cytochrome c-type biogenesis protein
MDFESALTSFSLGLLATASPCVLPLYPGFLAYLSGNRAEGGKLRYVLGLFVLGGVLAMMLLLGMVIALLSVPIGGALSVILPLADLAILSLGILLIANHNPFKSLPQIRVPVVSHPAANAFLYGLLYGPIALPCSGPLVVGIFAYSLTAQEAAGKLLVFLWFGLGFGMPLLVLSLLSGGWQKQLTRFFARHARAVNLVGGLLLIGLAIFDFAQNWELIRLYLFGN